MNMKRMSRVDVSFIENHVITILMVGVLGLGGWNLWATNMLQSTQGTNHEHLSGEIRVVDVKVDSLKENFSIRTLDRYTGADASRDKAQMMGEINLLKMKTNNIELHIRTHTDKYEHVHSETQ